MTAQPASVQSSAFRTINAAGAATKADGIPGQTAKAVLNALARRADGPTGEGAYPSTETLAEEACASRRAVMTALGALEAAGIIRRGDQTRVPRSRTGGRPVVVYDIAVDLLEERARRRQGGAPAPSIPAPGRPLHVVTGDDTPGPNVQQVHLPNVQIPHSQCAAAAHDLPRDLPTGNCPSIASSLRSSADAGDFVVTAGPTRGDPIDLDHDRVAHLSDLALSGAESAAVDTHATWEALRAQGITRPGAYLNAAWARGTGGPRRILKAAAEAATT